MFKFGLALGIVYEWLFGGGIDTLAGLEFAVLRTLCATLLAWMALESVRVLYLAAMALDDTPRAAPRNGPAR